MKKKIIMLLIPLIKHLTIWQNSVEYVAIVMIENCMDFTILSKLELKSAFLFHFQIEYSKKLFSYRHVAL